MKKNIILLIMTITGIISLIIGVKNTITSSKLYQYTQSIYQEGKDTIDHMVEVANKPKIHNYNDLINEQGVDVEGVKRVNLRWDLLSDGYEELNDTPVPSGYSISHTSDDYILIGGTSDMSLVLSESKMLEYIEDTFLPSDSECIGHRAYFEKRHKSNASDSEIGEYTYISNASNEKYLIKFEYYYKYDRFSKETSLDKYYQHVSIEKI